jgi:acyl carrier protein
MKIEEIISFVLTKRGKKVPQNISHSTKLRDIGFDSLDLAEWTVRVENKTGIDIFEDGIIETVGGILEKLEQK